MGAFGHARVHDVFFGSVTRHLLMASSVPLLLARRAWVEATHAASGHRSKRWQSADRPSV